MAHFALLWKARTIEKHRQNYENEKINSIIMSSSDVPDKTLFQRWRHYKHGMQKRLSRTFSKWYPEGSTVSNFFVSLQTDMKLPSILLRSLYGFIGGLLLTYLGFMFFLFQLSVSLMNATVLSSIIGVLLTLGLTLSNRMRCLIFLLVPQLFSRVGRYTLTCYALVLILTGPATNTLKNSEVLSESMACSQEQIKLNVRHINDSIKKPFNSIKDSLKMTIESMKLVVRKLKIALIRTNKLILNIASIIQSSYSWLGHVADVCNDTVGTPYQKCLKILKEHCNNIENYNFNDVETKTVKNNNRNVIRDILDAIGVKNIKQHQEENYFDVDQSKTYTEKNILIAKDKVIKKYEDVKKHNAKTDSNWYPISEDSDVRTLKGERDDKPWVCNMSNVDEAACGSLKSYEKFCVAADFAGYTFLATIRKKLKMFVCCISAQLHVQLNIQHSYTFIGNSSSSNQIAAGIVTEIRNRADPILTWLSWSSCVTSLFLLLIIFRAKHYQHMFETRSRFDNRFITKEFRELDLKRLRERRETVLPLNTRERAKYVTTTSFRLVASEKLHLNRSAVFMTVATFKLLIHIVADYSLFWVLTTIRHHGKLHSPLQSGITEAGGFIAGTGFVARLLQAFVDTMNMQLSFPSQDHSCLPNPSPPDVKRYCQIGFLIFLLWFFALFEPYGLRLRHLIMGHYRPQRAKDRAVWLYNHILRTRASFMKFARRKLHREYKYSSHSKLTLRQCLRNNIWLRWLTSLFGIKPDKPHCLLCNISEDTSDYNKELIKCEVPNCPGIYCACCFSDIGELCTVCLSPADYGDFSDVSLEKLVKWYPRDVSLDDGHIRRGSSDEDNSNYENEPDDDKPSGSYKRKSDSDSYTSENANDDGGNSKRKSFSKRRQLGYFFRNIKKKGSDTIPLLQGPVKRDAGSDVKQKNQSQIIVAKSVINISVCKFLHSNVKQQTSIKREEYDNVAIPKALNKYEYENMNNIKIISTVDVFVYSLYKITKNPLKITKSEHITNVAKYLRKNKLIRHKKYIQRYSKYFMSCSNNNINTIKEITKIGDDIGRDNDTSYFNRNEDAKNNISKKKLNSLYNETEHNNFESKNEPAMAKMRMHNAYKGEFYTALSKYWQNIKCLVLLDKSTMKTKEKLPPNRENKHKRKKKHKNTKKLTINEDKNPKLNGNSRLFAFLDERDWTNYYDTNNDNIDGDTPVKNHQMIDEKIIVNHITIPRLDLNLSSESINLHIQNDNEQEIYSVKRKDYAKHVVERFFKSLTCSSCELFNTSDVYNARDEFYNNTVNNPYLIQIQRQKQDSVCSKKYNASQSSTDSTSKTDMLPEDLKGFNIVRLSNPLLIVKNCCSSFQRKNKNKMDRKGINTNKPENVERGCDSTPGNVEAHVQTVRNKIIQCKTNNESKVKSSKRIDKNIADIIQNKKDIENKYEKGIQATLTQTDDKEVTAIPLMTSCGCQYLPRFILTQNFAAQVKLNSDYKKNTSICKDEKLMTCTPTCTCASQYHDANTKDVGIVNPKKCNYTKRNEETDSNRSSVETLDFDDDESKTDTTVCSYAKVDYSKTIHDLSNYQTGRFKDQVDETGRLKDPADHVERCKGYADHTGRLKERVDQIRRLKDNVDHTGRFKKHVDHTGRLKDQVDQTGRLNDHVGRYYKVGRLNDQFGKLKVRVVTKSNRSTLTDRTTRCDVSTDTYDWWSPLVEKKDFLKKNRPVDKRRKDGIQSRIRERRTYRNRGISTDEKIVTFRSKTQFIPSASRFGDIMSPSRYLFESQRYYNELFYNNNIFASPRVYPVTNLQRNPNSERDRSQINNCHHRRRGRKTKRLEESYSPRKDIQTSLRTRRFAFPRSPEPFRKTKKTT